MKISISVSGSIVTFEAGTCTQTLRWATEVAIMRLCRERSTILQLYHSLLDIDLPQGRLAASYIVLNDRILHPDMIISDVLKEGDIPTVILFGS